MSTRAKTVVIVCGLLAGAGAVARASSLPAQTFAFDRSAPSAEWGFIGDTAQPGLQSGSTSTSQITLLNTDSAGSKTYAVNLWNDSTGVSWDDTTFAGRPAIDSADLRITISYAMRYTGTPYNDGGNFDVVFGGGADGAITVNSASATNDPAANAIRAGQEMVRTVKFEFLPHVTIQANEFQMRLTSLNSPAVSGWEYSHIGVIDSTGATGAGEAPEDYFTAFLADPGSTPVSAQTTAPSGWVYYNSRSVINDNDTAAATTGAAVAEEFNPVSLGAVASFSGYLGGTSQTIRGFVWNQYFQGIDGQAETAAGTGSPNASFPDFKILGGSIIPVPEPSSGLLAVLGALGLARRQRR